MATEIEKEATEAFLDDNFELAVDLYSQAIDLTPNSAVLFADRAQAHIKLHHYTEAVSDANKAIELDPSMSKAYLRKGNACFKLEEYQTAKSALELGASLEQNDARFTNLIKECDAHIAAEASEASIPKETIQISADKSEPVMNSSRETQELPPAKPKYRHGYFQKPEEVVVTVFAKGIKAEHVIVEYGEQILSVRIDVPDEDAYHFQCRLFGKIIPDKCKYEVLSTKVEIRLAKAVAINWTSLEFSKETVVPQKVSTVSVQSHRPAYPSSKSRAKDWDKLEAEVKKEEKDEKLDGDAAVNKVFRDIYQSADEDMRRAMMKSFVESNGTVLSTNWSEVGAKKVEGSAPSGMEMKKWEY